MTKKNVKPVPFKYFHEKMKEEQDLLNLSMKESFRQRDERKMKEPYTIIHTKDFNCADDHPIVYYVVNEKGEGVCEYCYKRFKYEEKKSNTDFINDVLRGGQ
jgi:uncharacterized Zn-finger protein